MNSTLSLITISSRGTHKLTEFCFPRAWECGTHKTQRNGPCQSPPPLPPPAPAKSSQGRGDGGASRSPGHLPAQGGGRCARRLLLHRPGAPPPPPPTPATHAAVRGIHRRPPTPPSGVSTAACPRRVRACASGRAARALHVRALRPACCAGPTGAAWKPRRRTTSSITGKRRRRRRLGRIVPVERVARKNKLECLEFSLLTSSLCTLLFFFHFYLALTINLVLRSVNCMHTSELV